MLDFILRTFFNKMISYLSKSFINAIINSRHFVSHSIIILYTYKYYYCIKLFTLQILFYILNNVDTVINNLIKYQNSKHRGHINRLIDQTMYLPINII